MRSVLLKYHFAILVSIAGLIIKLLLAPIIGTSTPFLLLFTAVMLSAWYGGYGPGLLASSICALGASYLFGEHNGSYLFGWVEWTRSAVFLLEGIIFSLISEKRRRAEQALRVKEQQLSLIIDGTRDIAIFLLDETGRIMSWNSGAQKITGYRADEIIGEHFSIFFSAEDQDRWMPYKVLYEASEFGQHKGENLRLRKDGSTFWAEIVINSIIDLAGELKGFVVITRDTSERRQVEEEKARLLASEQAARLEAENANRLKDEFIAKISHELRTPLTPIMGWAKILRSSSVDELTKTRGLEAIERNIKQQSLIIDDLIDLSKISTGKLELDKTGVELEKIVEQVIETVKPSAAARAIKITKHFATTATKIYADPYRIKQIVFNLLSNAIKFSHKNGQVDISIDRNSAGNVNITVKDTGKGIKKEFLPYVFDRFRQADDSVIRNHNGLGIGLSIVRYLVELHDGTVSVASEGEGKGSTFTVTLPLLKTRAHSNAA